MQRRTDEQVRADVVAALKDAPVDALAISVTMREGVVELSGELASHSERLAAMTAAKAVAFPSPVRTSLTVAPVGRDFGFTDADVAIEVARALVQSDVPPGSVWFDVSHHVVTLRGTVADADQRARVRHLVRTARGVDFIENHITVHAKTPEASEV